MLATAADLVTALLPASAAAVGTRLWPVIVERVFDFGQWFTGGLSALHGHTGYVSAADSVSGKPEHSGGPRGFRLERHAADPRRVLLTWSDWPGAQPPVWRGECGTPVGGASFRPIELLLASFEPSAVPLPLPSTFTASEAMLASAAAFAERLQQSVTRARQLGVDSVRQQELLNWQSKWRFDVLESGSLAFERAAGCNDPLGDAALDVPGRGRVPAALLDARCSAYFGDVFKVLLGVGSAAAAAAGAEAKAVPAAGVESKAAAAAHAAADGGDGKRAAASAGDAAPGSAAALAAAAGCGVDSVLFTGKPPHRRQAKGKQAAKARRYVRLRSIALGC